MSTLLSKITPDVVKSFNDDIQRTFLDPLNPTLTDLDEQNKNITDHLLSEGITPEQIQHYVDVSRAQLDPYLEEMATKARMRAEIIAELEADKKAK